MNGFFYALQLQGLNISCGRNNIIAVVSDNGILRQLIFFEFNTDGQIVKNLNGGFRNISIDHKSVRFRQSGIIELRRIFSDIVYLAVR